MLVNGGPDATMYTVLFFMKIATVSTVPDLLNDTCALNDRTAGYVICVNVIDPGWLAKVRLWFHTRGLT